MTNLNKTPLENWIKAKIGLNPENSLTEQALAAYQLEKLQETLAYVLKFSPFYRKLFSGLPKHPVSCLEDLAKLPMTRADDICKNPMQFLCVSQSHIARAVTLQTSGTTNAPKRLFFTDADLELTVDFFHHGMSGIVRPGQKVLILMPGDSPESVGDLLVKALARMDVQGIVHGIVHDPEKTVREIIRLKIDSLVGIPAQVLSLVRHPAKEMIEPGAVRSVLLSSDYVPNAIVSEIRRVWGAKVFQHYGMTETGLGGGVECSALSGYHLREADILYEIVSPETGKPVDRGQTGEVVFTTLTREGMPLVRYRTGDTASFITAPCPCNTILRRMAKVQGRMGNTVKIGGSLQISLMAMDEAVFAVPGVMNYAVEIRQARGIDYLKIIIHALPKDQAAALSEVRQVILDLPKIRAVTAQGLLRIDFHGQTPNNQPLNGAAKRQIIDHRKENKD
ncbi:AMP-binding domain-containing protein [Desulfonema limicola]|uniref:AMP-binding domain-containing protein n=1 Tax=Desulfonema limicola TaxID=45656 RepID=A0A975GG59_9BACT|nr:AMP-binding protein [Desulfonema limicola]QTA79947.1 AMP-binding domain-containing protein [Desulfonema limicola]